MGRFTGSSPVCSTVGEKVTCNVSSRKKITSDLSDESQEAIRNYRRAELGLSTDKMATASETCKSLSTDSLLAMFKAITNELEKRAGEVPTQEEMWLVDNGDKITAVAKVRLRLNCDVPTALKILSLI